MIKQLSFKELNFTSATLQTTVRVQFQVNTNRFTYNRLDESPRHYVSLLPQPAHCPGRLRRRSDDNA